MTYSRAFSFCLFNFSTKFFCVIIYFTPRISLKISSLYYPIVSPVFLQRISNFCTPFAHLDDFRATKNGGTLDSTRFPPFKLYAGNRNRTGTGDIVPQDFKSCASASSAMPANLNNAYAVVSDPDGVRTHDLRRDRAAL